MVCRPGRTHVFGPPVRGAARPRRIADQRHVEQRELPPRRRRPEVVEHRPIDHASVQARSQRGIGSPLDEQAQGHQVDADRLDRAAVLTVWVLHRIAVYDELMEAMRCELAYCAASSTPQRAQHAGEQVMYGCASKSTTGSSSPQPGQTVSAPCTITPESCASTPPNANWIPPGCRSACEDDWLSDDNDRIVAKPLRRRGRCGIVRPREEFGVDLRGFPEAPAGRCDHDRPQPTVLEPSRLTVRYSVCYWR